MIRVLHVMGTMNRGGAETLIMELYRHIDRTKIQFDFLIYNYSDTPGVFDEEIKAMGGRLFHAKRRFYRNPVAFYEELSAFFKQHPEYKIVHAHQHITSGYVLAAAKTTAGSLTIAHSHCAFSTTGFLRKCAGLVSKALLKKYANFYFGCSNDAIVELSGKPADNRTRIIVNNAIDVEKFAFDQGMRQKWRAELGADDKTVIIGNVARFTSEKNHEHTIKSFARLAENNNNSMLVLVGDGPLRPETEKLAAELGVIDKTVFLGVRGDVHELINAFDVFVMPSRYEGLGIVLIEAQANGLPCVISADVIPREADTNAGLVTRVSLNETPEVWANACLNAGSRKSSGEVRPAIVEAGYDIHAVSGWLQDFYLSHWN